MEGAFQIISLPSHLKAFFVKQSHEVKECHDPNKGDDYDNREYKPIFQHIAIFE